MAPRIQAGAFSGHETFPLRFTWLPKAIREVETDPQAFSDPDQAMVRLGVGKNMVKSMRHWALATEVLEEEGDRGQRSLRPSVLGQRILGAEGLDPYLEQPATLWFLHWRVAGRPDRTTTWYWAFNHAPQPDFTKDDLTAWLLGLIEERGWRATAASLKRDIDVFIRSYVPSLGTKKAAVEDVLDCPLVELDLIHAHEERGRFIIDRHPRPTLPDALFAFALVEYLGRTERTAMSVPLDEIALAAGSPGRTFALSERDLLGRLERLSEITESGLVYDETAGLRQVHIHRMPEALPLLERCYSEPS